MMLSRYTWSANLVQLDPGAVGDARQPAYRSRSCYSIVYTVQGSAQHSPTMVPAGTVYLPICVTLVVILHSTAHQTVEQAASVDAQLFDSPLDTLRLITCIALHTLLSQLLTRKS